MGRTHREIVLLWGLIIFFSWPARGERDADNLNCVSELELPQFAVAQRVPKGGTVLATITVGPNGKPESIDFGKADRSLALEVGLHLRQKATYDPRCVGKQVRLQFTFRVAGEPTHYPFARVRFRPPNHFIIITQPLLPTSDYFPTAPKEEQVRGKP